MDIDFGRACGNKMVFKPGYKESEHEKQIQRYIDSGATYVFIGNPNLAKKMNGNNGVKVEYDNSGVHDNHDHVNV